MDNDINCDCFNYTTEKNPNGCFNFHEADDLLFTFRGKTIYQSIMRQLMYESDKIQFGKRCADKVILAGSNAGGVGVVNHANWTHGVLNSSTTLNVYWILPCLSTTWIELRMCLSFRLPQTPVTQSVCSTH